MQNSSLCLWQVVAASVVGVSHEKVSLPCQDAHRWRILPDGRLLAAVADGAGSAERAEIGAAIAADAAIDYLSRLGPSAPGEPICSDVQRSPEPLAGALRAARRAVEEEAERSGVELRELACTLIVAVAGPEGLSAAQVGDGAVIVANELGALFAVTRPPEAEYANETTFLISEGALETVQFGFFPSPVAQFAVFTDGLQRLALTMPDGAPHAPFFQPLFRFAANAADLEEATRQLALFLKSPRITERADDDLTLLLATRRK